MRNMDVNGGIKGNHHYVYINLITINWCLRLTINLTWNLKYLHLQTGNLENDVKIVKQKNKVTDGHCSN